jgi:hypothetical protein
VITCGAFTKNTVGRIESASTDLLTGEYRLIGNSVPKNFHADMTALTGANVSTKTVNLVSPYPQDIELVRILVSKNADGNTNIELK